LNEKSLTEWFEKRKKSNIMKMLREHTILTTKTFENFYSAVKYDIGGEKKKSIKHCEIVAQVEKEVDELRRKIINELARSELSATDRGDLMSLIHEMDQVADWINGAGRILRIISMKEFSEEIKNASMDIISSLDVCVKKLNDCILKFVEGENVLEITDEIERIEEKVDHQHTEAKKILLSPKHAKMLAAEVFLLLDFLDALENIADECEDVCDIIRMIIVKIPMR
jgi:predicted phosphate transport protein (TIGR00153 family)